MMSSSPPLLQASLYGATKRFRESEQLFHKAIELNPLYTEAYFNLGMTHEIPL